MSILLHKKSQSESPFTLAIEQWLLGDVTGHLGAYMYTNDTDDQRWKQGHSSPAYYLGADDKATFDIAIKELGIKVPSVIDLGPGGKASVVAKTLPLLRAVEAHEYLPVDLSQTLAKAAVDVAHQEIHISGHSIVADFFRPMSLRAPHSLLAFMGGTLANIETYQNKSALQQRLTTIFNNFANVVSQSGYMLISFDANTNPREIVDCYHNPELGELIKGCVERAISVDNFDYDVVWTGDNYQLATGLRSRYDQIIKFNGGEYAIEKDEFLPVLNSYRFPTEFVKEAAAHSGWKHRHTWSATGRTHYLLFEHMRLRSL